MCAPSGLILLSVALAAMVGCSSGGHPGGPVTMPDASCGASCPDLAVCQGAQCPCVAPRMACGAGCADVTSDTDNCGSCGTVCSATNGAPSCQAGRCALTCQAGFGDCDLSPANGCETDLSSDAANCGQCGHDCGGLDCAASACQPFAVATGVADLDCALASDNTSLYYAAGMPAVLRRFDGPGATAMLATLSAQPSAMVVDAGGVEISTYGQPGTVQRVPTMGGMPTILTANEPNPDHLRSDPSGLVWRRADTWSIARLAAGGKVPVEIVPNGNPSQFAITDLAVSGGTLYYLLHRQSSYDDTLHAYDLGTGSTRVIGALMGVYNVAVSSAGIFVTILHGQAQYADVLASVDQNGTVTPIAAGLLIQGDLVADDKNLYWVDITDFEKGAPPRLLTIPTAGGMPRTIASAPHLIKVLVDAHFVYWCVNDYMAHVGSIFRAPR